MQQENIVTYERKQTGIHKKIVEFGCCNVYMK